MSKPGKPVSIEVPGSKSLSNRALILSVLCNKQTTIKNVALCDDTSFMIRALKQLGVKIHQDGTTVKIQGILQNGKLNFPKKKKTIRIFTGNAGTTTRFLTALAPLTGDKIIIDGDARMRERPITELVKALNALGAKIESTNGYPPLKIRSSTLNGGKISLPGNISSQYLSAILMVAPFAIKKTTINIEQKLYSKPYISMTLKMMKEFGFKIMNKKFRQFIIEPIHQTSQATARATEKLSNLTSPQSNEQNKPGGKKITRTYAIESDASSASYIGAYAALHPGEKILLKNIHKNSLQGDIKFLEYLKKMGCKTVEQKNGTIIQGPQKLKSLGTMDMNETPDLVMTFAVLALFTKGKTKITNIANLRIKETDRLVALENEIKKLANALNLKKLIAAKIGKDWIEIYRLKSVPAYRTGRPGDKLKNKDNNSQFNQIYRLESPDVGESQEKSAISQAIINTYNDHRIAMSFGILTDIFPFLKIENPSCVSKSYTTFWDDLKKCQNLNAYFKSNKTLSSHKAHTNIVLTGLRGSGKSKIGKIMAEKITKLTKRNWNFIDIDAEIENRENTTIHNIVEIHGWEYFRAVESQVAKKVSKLKNTVIATGGGTIIDKENEKFFKKTGKIVYLHVKPKICASRILNSSSRPPLTNKKSVKEEIKHLYKERNGRYRKSANLIFERSEDLEKDAGKIIKKLNLHI